MADLHISLRPVDRVEITTVIDNYVDVLLGNSDVVKRPALGSGKEIPTDTLVAEHGLCLLVTVHDAGNVRQCLFDTGYSPIGVLHNMDVLDIDGQGIEAVVISHAHMDHTGALHQLLQTLPRPLTLVVHPGAFQAPRYIKRPDGRLLRFPRTLVREDLLANNVNLVESKEPVLISDGHIMVTGEIERTTEFEKGLPGALMEKNGEMVPDPIADDQALAIHLKGKGLVVISGCSHSGIINTVTHARKLTGVARVHAVLGGFHLTGPAFEPIIERTISELKGIGPEVIVPMHCTGWRALERFAQEFPGRFVLNSVGSTIYLS